MDVVFSLFFLFPFPPIFTKFLYEDSILYNLFENKEKKEKGKRKNEEKLINVDNNSFFIYVDNKNNNSFFIFIFGEDGDEVCSLLVAKSIFLSVVMM
jgi:hypothetical protein